MLLTLCIRNIPLNKTFQRCNELTWFDFFFNKKSTTNSKEKKQKKRSQRDTCNEKKGRGVIQSGELPSLIMIELDYGKGEELVNISCLFFSSFSVCLSHSNQHFVA